MVETTIPLEELVKKFPQPTDFEVRPIVRDSWSHFVFRNNEGHLAVTDQKFTVVGFSAFARANGIREYEPIGFTQQADPPN